MLIDALPLSLKGALTMIGSYKKSYTSFTRPLALGTVQECWVTVLLVDFWRPFGLSVGLSVGV